MVKTLPANAGVARDAGSIPGTGRCPGVGNGNPLQYSWLKTPVDKGAWQATVHGLAKSQRQLSNWTTTKLKLKRCYKKTGSVSLPGTSRRREGGRSLLWADECQVFVCLSLFDSEAVSSLRAALTQDSMEGWLSGGPFLGKPSGQGLQSGPQLGMEHIRNRKITE